MRCVTIGAFRNYRETRHLPTIVSWEVLPKDCHCSPPKASCSKAYSFLRDPLIVVQIQYQSRVLLVVKQSCLLAVWHRARQVLNDVHSVLNGEFLISFWTQYLKIIPRREDLLKGLARISFIPWAKYVIQSVSVVFEVIEMMGVLLSNSRMRVVAVTPSKLGITMSMRTMSYLYPTPIRLTASRPSTAMSKLQPKIWSSFEDRRRQVSSSSTSKTLGGAFHWGGAAFEEREMDLGGPESGVKEGPADAVEGFEGDAK